MQGAPRRQVNAEDMLAELKRALESSTHTPDAPPPSASTAPKPSLPGPATGRSQIDNGSGRPAKANTDKPTRPRTELQKSTRPNSRSWKLIAGGLALAVAATIGVSFAFMGKPSNLPEPEPTVAATEGPVRPQNEQTPEPSSSPRAPMQDSRQAAPLQAGNLGTRPDASTAPLIGGSLSAGGKAEVDAPNLASSGLETAVPASAPLLLDSTRHAGGGGKDRAGWGANCDSAIESRVDQFSASGWDAKACGRDGRPANGHAGQGVPRDRAAPLPPRPVQRRLWLRRRSRPPRRRPHKSSSQIRRQSRQRRPPGLRPIRRRLGLRRRSRAQSRQHPCRTNRRSHRSRRSIQRRNRLRRSHGKSLPRARKPQQNQFRLSDDRLSRRRRKKRRARPTPRKTSAIRLPQRRLRRQAFSSGWLMGSRTPSAT